MPLSFETLPFDFPCWWKGRLLPLEQMTSTLEVEAQTEFERAAYQVIRAAIDADRNDRWLLVQGIVDVEIALQAFAFLGQEIIVESHIVQQHRGPDIAVDA